MYGCITTTAVQLYSPAYHGTTADIMLLGYNNRSVRTSVFVSLMMLNKVKSQASVRVVRAESADSLRFKKYEGTVLISTVPELPLLNTSYMR